MKIKLTTEQSQFIKGRSNTYSSPFGYVKMYFIPTIFISSVDDEEDIYTEKNLSKMNHTEIRELGIDNIFTLQDMENCFNAGVRTSNSVKEGLFTFEDYIK